MRSVETRLGTEMDEMELSNPTCLPSQGEAGTELLALLWVLGFFLLSL